MSNIVCLDEETFYEDNLLFRKFEMFYDKICWL